MKKRFIYICCSILGLMSISCGKFLDVVPDNVLSLEQVFDTRQSTWQMLHTCYDYMPKPASITTNPALLLSDEVINPVFDPSYHYYRNRSTEYIASGRQSADNPLVDYWDGANYDYLNQRWGDSDDRGNLKSLWAGIRKCNIMIDNVDRVPDMQDDEKLQWKAEMYVLRAYYHYYLLQMYGPIPYIDEELSISQTPEEIQRPRESVDAVITKIVNDIDIAINSGGLPATLAGKRYDLGRINLPVAKAIKAKVLILGASPMFNGNTKYANFRDLEGNPLFNQVEDVTKWDLAANACIEAIQAAKDAGLQLYTFDATEYTLNVDSRTIQELTLRAQITDNVDNSELVWGIGRQNVQQLIFHASTPLNSDQIGRTPGSFNNLHGATMNVVDQFYSNNGVPIDEDNTYNYEDRYKTVDVPEGEELYFNDESGTKVPIYNTFREPRFYAYLSFDQGRYFCLTTPDDTKSEVIRSKNGDFAGVNKMLYTPTGYSCKKLIPWNRQHIEGQINNIQEVLYFFPIIRLSDLYLLAAEALNEAGRAKSEVLEYLQPVRNKAGLDKETGSLDATWAMYSKFPTKPNTKEGMRAIIKQERMIELAFEGQRYWDIRRWNEAELYFNRPLMGWNIKGSNNVEYYQVKAVANRTFTFKDYLWPIKQTSVDINYKLNQAPGW